MNLKNTKSIFFYVGSLNTKINIMSSEELTKSQEEHSQMLEQELPNSEEGIPFEGKDTSSGQDEETLKKIIVQPPVVRKKLFQVVSFYSFNLHLIKSYVLLLL